MYKLYYELDTPEVLNIATVNYSRHMHTQQYSHGGSVGVEPIGQSFSDLCLEGPCDYLTPIFFNNLYQVHEHMNINPRSSFHIKDDDTNFHIKVSGGYIKKWYYNDSETRSSDLFSLTLGVTNIQRLVGGKINKLASKKVKEKKIVLPERQIVICRTI